MFFLPMIAAGQYFIFEVVVAVVPAIILMIYIYRQDRIEREPGNLLGQLVGLGALAGVCSIFLETIGTNILDSTYIDSDSAVYTILMAFLVVALVEEGMKYLFLNIRTWKNPNFNFRFDGIVYAVFISLGFAAFENILYIFSYGISIAPMRALVSIPGHMSFSVVYGIFYGRAKMYADDGDTAGGVINRIVGYILAVFCHGFYDTCAMIGDGLSTVFFVAYCVVMYLIIFLVVKKEAKTDMPV